MHNLQVNAAAQKALDVFKRAHPDVDEKDLKVEPLAPPPLAFPIPGVPPLVPLNMANMQAAAWVDLQRVANAHLANAQRLPQVQAAPAPRRPVRAPRRRAAWR